MKIDLHHVTKHFGAFTALDRVDLDIGSGELVALLGPSGSGKTTLLRIIAGLDWPDVGEVRFDGEDALSRSIGERNVGFVFQQYALFRHMSVFENVAFGLRARRRSRRLREAEIRARVEKLLDLVQLDGLAGRLPNQLSGGQRQRVALARALAIEPRVLLLDEPFGALDAKVRKELRRWLRQLHDEIRVTSVFVTHDQEEALAVADRVGVMSQGKLEQLAAPADLYANPATPFVAEFVGLNNKVPAEVSGGQAKLLGTSVPTLEGSIAAGSGLAMVRPESVTVSSDPAGTSTVSSVAFLGPISRVYAILTDGSVISAQMASSRAKTFSSGDPVTVGVEPTGVLVVKQDGAA